MASTTELAYSGLGWPYEVGQVTLADLRVDDTYQRPLNKTWVDRTEKVFDPLLVGALFVNRRDDGNLYLIDGQQRAALLGNVGMVDAFAVILEGLNAAQEAEVFYKLNKERLRVSPWYEFRARLVARDPRALEVNVAVSRAGYLMGPATDDADIIGAVRACERSYTIVSNLIETPGACMIWALEQLHQNWRGRKHSTDGGIIIGLTRLRAIFGHKLDPAVMADVFDAVSPAQIIGMATDKRSMASSHNRAGFEVAAVFFEQYNRQVPAKERLDIKEFGKRRDREEKRVSDEG